jgi:hypothetical protein
MTLLLLLTPILSFAAGSTLTAKNMQSLVKGIAPQLIQCSVIENKPVLTKKLKNRTDESIDGKKLVQLLEAELKQKSAVEFAAGPPADGGHFDLVLSLTSSRSEKGGKYEAEYTLEASLKDGEKEQCQASAGIQKTGTVKRRKK